MLVGFTKKKHFDNESSKLALADSSPIIITCKEAVHVSEMLRMSLIIVVNSNADSSSVFLKIVR